MVRVRFAPSPTGNLHIGTLRTALFNWLFARHHKGVFILRIEDTDLQRSEAQYETNILEGLEWLGLTVDEGPNEGGDYGPYRQSERIEQGAYKRKCEALLASGAAYYCFDTDEELEAEREEAKEKGVPYKYSRKALTLSEDQVKANLDSGMPYTIRFKMPDEGTLVYKDLIRGDIEFDLSLVSDFVIMKSDGSPAYNFACVVDDMDMAITHVIRGEDHISNMTRQLALFNAFGHEAPQFAHMPMILGPDKAKLSKRHGATSVTSYRDEGYLADAFFNFLTLLGWSPDSEEEFFSKEELIAQFGLERVSKSNAVFDSTKLTWMNGQYLRKISPEDFEVALAPYISEEVNAGLSKYTPEQRRNALYSVITNMSLMSEVNQYMDVYVRSEEEHALKVSELEFNESNIDVLTRFKAKVDVLDVLTKDAFESILEEILDETGLGKGKVFLPVRLALSGQKQGPNMGDYAHVLGKELVVMRLQKIVG
jgi:glutamyl-tRNA synthetase